MYTINYALYFAFVNSYAIYYVVNIIVSVRLIHLYFLCFGKAAVLNVLYVRAADSRSNL